MSLNPNPTLPPWWQPPKQNPQASRSDINSTATSQSMRHASVSPDGTILPIIFGRDTIGPIVSLVNASGNYLYMRCVWCLGEIEAIEKVALQDGTVPAGVVMTHYTGRNDQGVDPTLAALIPGYQDTGIVQVGGEQVGVAYSVLKIPAQANLGFPRFVATIKGKKIRNPKGGAFFPKSSYDGDFSTITETRIKLGFDGTAAKYTASPNTRATKAGSMFWADGLQGTTAGVLRLTSSGGVRTIFDHGNGKVKVYVDTDDKLRIVLRNSSNTVILDAKSTTAFFTDGNKSNAFIISWNLNSPGTLYFYQDGVKITPVSPTLTVGQSVNYSASGSALGGEYGSTSNPLAGHLGTFTFSPTVTYDLSSQSQVDNVFDAKTRLKNPMTWLGTNAYITGFLARDGYPYGSPGTGFLYTSTPAVLTNVGTTWKIVGASDKTKYVYMGVEGGLYYYNLAGDASYYLKPNNEIPNTTGELNYVLFASITPGIGSAVIGLTFENRTLMTLDSSKVRDSVGFAPIVGGDLLTVKPGSGTTIFTLTAFNLCPDVNEKESYFRDDWVPPLGGGGTNWTVLSGTATKVDPINGGFQSANAVVYNATPMFFTNDLVYYEIEVGGTFTGSVRLEFVGGTLIKTITAPGVYKGYVTSPSSSLQLTFNCSAGSAIVYRVYTKTQFVNKQYTQTPAAFLADLLESKVYGLGAEVDTASLITAMDFNEEIVFPGNEKRWQAGISLVTQQPIQSWIETIRAYARCMIIYRDGKYYLIPDRPASSIAGAITKDDIYAKSFKLQKRSLINQPNVVKVFYTNTLVEPWTEDFVEATLAVVDDGTEFRRESAVRMPGIQSKTMAYRFAVERLNSSTLIDLSGSLEANDSAFKYEVGDVIELSHPVGLVSKQVRITSIEPVAKGKLAINFLEYSPDIYSDEIIDTPPPPDFSGATPFNVPVITGLTLVEEFYTVNQQTKSRLRATWNAVSYPFLQYYVVEIREAGVKAQLFNSPDTSALYPDLQVGVSYSVIVYAVSVAFAQGAPATATLVAQGSSLPPDFSQGQIVAFEVSDGLAAYVNKPALDLDLWGYEWRYREIPANNLIPAGGVNFNAGDWTASLVTIDVATYRSFILSSIFGGGGVYTSLNALTAGKKYAVYVKLKNWITLPPLQDISLIIGPDWADISSGTTDPQVLLLSRLQYGSNPGLYVIKEVTVPTPNTGYNFTIQADAFYPFAKVEFEYIAFREVPSDCENDWSTSLFIDRSPSSNVRIEQVIGGDYLVYCKALDSVRSVANPYGQYSLQTQQAYTRIISDADAFFRSVYPISDNGGTLTRIGLFPRPSDQGMVFDANGVTDAIGYYMPDAGNSFNTQFPTPINSYVLPLYSYFKSASLAHVFQSETYDLKSALNGKATIYYSIKSVIHDPNSAVVKLKYKNNSGDPWTTVTTNLNTPINFVGRFLAVEITFGATISLALEYTKGFFLNVEAFPKVETGTITTFGPDGGGNPQAYYVTLQNIYNKVVSARAWSKTSESLDVYVDNFTFTATETKFSIIALNLRGYPISAAVNWEFKGV